MNAAELIVPIVIALVGGGGIFALFKIRPEAAQVTVQAAESVVIIQKDEITRLVGQVGSFRTELDTAMREVRGLKEDLRAALETVKHLEEEVAELRAELERTRQERDTLASEKAALEKKVAGLEARVNELENGRR